MSQAIFVSALRVGLRVIDPNHTLVEIRSVESSVITYKEERIHTRTVSGVDLETGAKYSRVAALGEVWQKEI